MDLFFYHAGFRPRYEVALDQRWVRVILSEGTAQSYYAVASSLVVGLNAEEIVDIFLLDVLFL
ncbi:MAG: hypothetical protein DMF61_16290 [Blastocatellia bacterium AA13]|nr:MAG: hypothetical protein DMF61_16290 [Blastocatellia bacterium AA13]